MPDIIIPTASGNDYSISDFVVYRFWEDMARLLYQGYIPECVSFIMKSPRELILTEENFKRIGLINDRTRYEQNKIINRTSINQIYPSPVSELEELLRIAKQPEKPSMTPSGIIIPKGVSI